MMRYADQFRPPGWIENKNMKKVINSDIENIFISEEMHRNDPRLKQFLKVPAEELQPSFHAAIQLISGPDELEIEDVNLWHRFGLTDEDFNHLQSIGRKGRLRVAGSESAGHPPFKSRTLIIARHQIKEQVDLPQPNSCEIIYYQADDGWRKIPPDAPVLKKRFRLSVDPKNRNLTHIWAEAYFESDSGGGGGFIWSTKSS